MLQLPYGWHTFLDEGNVRYDLQGIVVLLWRKRLYSSFLRGLRRLELEVAVEDPGSLSTIVDEGMLLLEELVLRLTFPQDADDSTVSNLRFLAAGCAQGKLNSLRSLCLTAPPLYSVPWELMLLPKLRHLQLQHGDLGGSWGDIVDAWADNVQEEEPDGCSSP